MLSILMALALTAAAQAEPGSGWDDPPQVIGAWRLTCTRDGAFTSWNHVEGCSARASAGKVRLFIVRTANEASTGMEELHGCPPQTGWQDLPVQALGKPGPARIRLVRDALRRTIKAAVDQCGVGPELKGFVVRDSDIAAILEASEGLQDLNGPGS
jgi:hypothetical protein